ncbi:MAG: GntR family transcriptional regulator [Acidimicrobiia bacterium]|nr:MAG: GntR family transcriptional regulator [Acidimicrobiia bacterium]
MITRNPSLTEQVKAHIKDLILDGGFVDGRIPPEAELAEELGVSRTTVRDALSRLEHEGAVSRRQGSGTFVNVPVLQIKSRLEEIWSYEQVLEDHGYTPSVEVLKVATVAADDSTSAVLDLDGDSEVLLIEKLFLEDDRPVVLTINRIPSDIVTDAEYERHSAIPVYEFLEQHCGRTLAYYVSDIVPVQLDDEQADRLGIDAGTLAVSFDEVGYDQDNEPVVRATSYFRDDLLRFRLIRRRTGQ